MPNLTMVIPVMDHIDKTLATYSRNRKYLPSIRSAVSLAKKTLNRYYSLTDWSEVYCITMGKNSTAPTRIQLMFELVLHPWHKLSYFKTPHWPDEWVKTAEELVTVEFERTYNNCIDGANVIDVEEVIPEPKTTKKVSCLSNNCHYYLLHPCFLARQHIRHPPCTRPSQACPPQL